MGKKQDDDIIKGKRAEDIPDLNQVMKDLREARDELEQVRSEQLVIDNQLKRAVADYQNLEKRVAEGRSELTNWATTELIKKLLSVLDHFDKVVELGRPVLSERSESKDWYKGVELATQQLQQVLKDEGLEEIAADGQFDPALHEAVDTREGENDKILEVAEKGYKLNGKILKPARVVVGRKN